ncbi:putative P-loop ATPase fused to an acetyltransferase [Halovivax ruber XH-70]|uniref:tRNA(Met) cytidine acetyltransferase TmcA n=1 Tax=Halovivax ruber (strain DSM 18193 / JCM 13892 / XH-70) TaxID=797302 RepID=L0IC04_HALRX|nr:tRNA(Met) cytidine acetyltransferase TmcA [Halovivax ruber]AGB16333.1 putative P-loop ATPase fused to an acetyltransferase [Halovivax ruber XH-70]
MNSVALAADLVAEAATVDERRLLVLAGDREVGYSHLEGILDTLDVPISQTTLVGPDDRLRCEHLTQSTAGRLLGTTRDVVAVDAHRACRPNALGRVVGAVDGGGLVILLTPSLETWPDRRDAFDETLASPPYTVDDVTGHFRRRLVETLETHPGIGIVDVDDDRVIRSGRTDPAPQLASQSDEQGVPADAVFPDEAFEACLTADQRDTVAAFEPFLATPNQQTAVVVEADRGRGKSSAAGLAAGALAAAGLDVAVTAPSPDGCLEVFARARELAADLDSISESEDPQEDDRIHSTITTASGGRVRFATATEVDSWIDEPDVVIVDEAAALPVSILETTLAAERVAYATTVHGYEGTGRGFDVRFRDRLDEGVHDVLTRSLVEPIRYAAGDPIETWAFRVLALDARPPVEPLIADATVSNVSYEHPDPAALVADEHRLRETFGLLVLAHYRTEPTDLARLLDAPNVTVRTLERDGHVVAVALLAREGGLDADWRADMYEGVRIRGNMIPDVLTSQLRDESAGAPVGYRVIRIATHHAVRSCGLGSHLLSKIREEVGSEADWLGSGFGATPELLRFWHRNGYETIHASTTRNDRSGEYSAIVVHPTSERGEALRDRHTTWFARRLPAVLADALEDLAVDTARALLRSIPAAAVPALPRDPHSWRVVAGAAYGPGLFDVDPGPFRPLIVRAIIEQPALPGDGLSTREERLLVRRGLQARAWSSVADELGYHSTGQCMRSFGDALTPLVDHYGTDARSVGDDAAETVRALRTRFDGE